MFICRWLVHALSFYTVFLAMLKKTSDLIFFLEHSLNYQYLRTQLQNCRHISPFLIDETRIDRCHFVSQQHCTCSSKLKLQPGRGQAKITLIRYLARCESLYRSAHFSGHDLQAFMLTSVISSVAAEDIWPGSQSLPNFRTTCKICFSSYLFSTAVTLFTKCWGGSLQDQQCR